MTEAFVLLTREPRSEEVPGIAGAELAERKLAAIRTIAEAAGAHGMVGGQALDLKAAEPGAAPLGEMELREMHARKTGALLQASAVAGAIMAGAPEDVLAAIAAYGTHIGLAFQIVDDILDVEGASAVLGKTAGKDAAAGKPTYSCAHGLRVPRRAWIRESRPRGHRPRGCQRSASGDRAMGGGAHALKKRTGSTRARRTRLAGTRERARALIRRAGADQRSEGEQGRRGAFRCDGH